MGWDGPNSINSLWLIRPAARWYGQSNVEGQCRTPGSDSINNTFGTAVAATVTMVTAQRALRGATAVITPNTACAGGRYGVYPSEP